MAVDDELIYLKEVPAVVAELRPGSKPKHPTTVARWCTRGVRGVKLWSVPEGWARMTTRRAVREFLDQLADRYGQPDNAPATEREQSRRQKAAAAQLTASGW